MVATGVRRLILKPRRPSTGINSLRDLGIAFLKNYYTQTIVLYTSDLLVVHEVAVSARTCTQPLSELATASAGCGEVPEQVAGVAFGAPAGTCKQCTPQATVICGDALLRGASKLRRTTSPANKQ